MGGAYELRTTLTLGPSDSGTAIAGPVGSCAGCASQIGRGHIGSGSAWRTVTDPPVLAV